MDDADQHSALGEQEVKGLSILAIAQNKRRLHRHFLLGLALCLVFTLVMANSYAGKALAASVGDVVTQVSNANFTSTEFQFGQEEATGYGFTIHQGFGNFGSGGCQLSVLGPAQPDEIQIMINYVDSISQVSYMQTTQLKGAKVREYATEYGVGIGVILPDYFITVETLETGQSQSADTASARSIAQQTIDAMEKAGLLSQAAPDIIEEEPQKAEGKTEDVNAAGGQTGQPLDEPVRVADTTNIMAVYNGPTEPTIFSFNSPHLVTEIHDYHWNDAQGATPGTIGLQDQNGKMYGPWQAVGTPGQGGVPNANWYVYPNIIIPAGTYTIIDSDPSTWSQNGESGGKGMSYVMATPHFETTGAAPGGSGSAPGSYPPGHSHSPAGVGSVGNIPGPSNTTEAVTGVVVPGLIATALGALGGMGGGGFVPPAGGTPMYPTGGGSLPGAGGIPRTSGGGPGMVQATSQFGRRGREEIFVDTTDMYKGSAIQAGPTDQGMYIETEREAGLFVQPEPFISDPGPEIFIDTIDMNQQSIDVREAGGEPVILIDTEDMFEGPAAGATGEPKIFIETEAEAGLFVQPEPFISDPGPEIFIDTIDMNQQAIDVREAGGEPVIRIDTDDMFESPAAGRAGQPEILIETEAEAGRFVSDKADFEMEADVMKKQAFDAREGEASGKHFAAAGSGDGAPAAEPSEHLYTDSEDAQVLRDSSSLEDSAGTETATGSEGAFDQNGFDAEGFDKEGFDQAGFDRDGYNRDGFNEAGYNAEGFDQEGFNEAGYNAEGFDQEGFDQAGFDRDGYNQDGFNGDGYNRDGFNEAGYNAEGFDQEGFNQAGFDAEGFDREGFDQEGFNAEGFDKDGYNQEGYDKSGYDKEGFDSEGRNSSDYDREGYNSQGYDQNGFDKNGFDKDGFNRDGFNSQGFDRDGFDANGFDAEGFDKAGFDAEGFDKAGFDKEGFDKAGFNAQGFDKEGFDKAGFDREGFNREGFDQAGFNKEGFDKTGYDAEGFNREGFNQQGFDREGFDKAGFDAEGYDRQGFDQSGFDQEGFNKEGFDKAGFNREGYNKAGFDQEGFDRNGFNAEGYDKEGFNQAGFDKAGYDREGFNKEGFDKAGFDKEGFDKAGFNTEGFDREGFNQAGFDQEGFDRQGFDKAGLDREGFNKAGFDTEGYDREGFNKEGFDREGFGRNGFDPEGFDREGFDVNGYDRKGFNRQGFDAKGFDKQGFDKEGFDQAGWDREGYDRNGFDQNGWDREGYDKNGYDADGYDRDGYNREGQSQEGYDADGYDKKGFNEHGYDRDGYDREGFDFEGYNRGGRDPWGFDKQGYGKDGYHWSGYNADGYDRSGLHWSENPYGEGSPFDVDTRNPFDGGIVDLGGRKEAWKPTKPPLGEPYHRTVEKYGAKPWDDEIPKTEPSTSGSGVIGQDFEETLKNHDVGDGGPDGQDGSGLPIPEEDIPQGDWPSEPEERFPADQIPETQPGNTFDYTDPETGVTSTYEYEPGYTGPRHGEQQTLVGTGDGQTYEVEFNAVTGKWVNTETGNDFDPDRFESWQQDVAEDKRRAAIDLEKMAKRQDATSKAIDKNLEDWRKLEQMQRAADKYGIGTPGGPGDVDKAIQSLKDDMLAGKELDQEKMDKIRGVIDNRILGKTAADTGQRWEEDWFKNMGWALESNLATAREVFSGEKADGSISYLGTLAKITMLVGTAGLAGSTSLTYATLDGGMNVAEALFRIKDEIDKGGSDFRAVSKAMGIYILGEQMGWLAGKGMGALGNEMLERFPAFTNKAADFIETALLKVSAKNQMFSKALGMISKESAEESLDQINKRLVDIGSDAAARGITKTARADYGLKAVADSFDDVSKSAGKTIGDTTGDMGGRVSKSAAEGWTDVGESGGRATTSSSDDIARGGGRATTSSSDDIARGGGKVASQADADGVPGTGKAASQADADGVPGTGKAASQADADGVPGTGKAASQADADGVPGTGKAASQADGDGVQVPRKAGDDISDASAKSSATGGDVPGEPPGRPPGGGDGPGEPPGSRPPGGGDDTPGEPDHLPLNRGGRTPEEVLADPAAVTRAERTVQENIKDFDNLPPARREELIREQAIYEEYKMQAEERVWNLSEKVQRGEPLTVEEIMEMKSDPASMRTLKNLHETDGLGSQLTPQEARGIQMEFNRSMDENIHQPSYGAVEDHLRTRYPQNGPGEVRCRTVRTPGTEPDAWNVNTDNDVIAERLVHGPNGPEWVEVPRAEWEDTYYKAFAENSGFSPDEAARRFPDTDWANMDEAAQVRQWARHHEEAAMDQFDLSAGRDFSDQRTWRIQDGNLPGRPMIEATPEEIQNGVDYVMVDGRPMRPSTGYELTQRGQGTMLDPEQLSLMETNKFDGYWNAGDTPAQVMRNQTEALEQMRKTANVAQTVESSYRNMGYRVEAMPDNMQQAIKVINNNDLSPAARAARLQELGYSSPGDFLNKVSSRIGAIRTAHQ